MLSLDSFNSNSSSGERARDAFMCEDTDVFNLDMNSAVSVTSQPKQLFNKFPCQELIEKHGRSYMATAKGQLAVGVAPGQLAVIDAYCAPALGYTSVSAQQFSEAQPDCRFLWEHGVPVMEWRKKSTPLLMIGETPAFVNSVKFAYEF